MKGLQASVADVCNARDDGEYQVRVARWATAVWTAYAPQHQPARDYLAAVAVSLGRRPR